MAIGDSREAAVEDDPEIVFVFDTVERKPACVLLQTAMGGDSPKLHGIFSADSWLIAPTPNMKRHALPRSKWIEVARHIGAGMTR